MFSLDKSIKELYETHGASPSDIALELELEEAAVKMSLTNHSSKYRKSTTGIDKDSLTKGLINSQGNVDSNDAISQKDEDITDDEFKEILDAYKHLALNSDNDMLREKAQRYLLEAKKAGIGSGLLSQSKKVEGTTFNIAILNTQLQESKKIARELAAGVIDIMDPSHSLKFKSGDNAPNTNSKDRAEPITVSQY